MPRFYLHIRSQMGLSQDPEGEDLPEIGLAHAAAVSVVRRTRSSAYWTALSPEAQRAMVIEVADESGQTVLTVPFIEDERRTC